MWSPVAWTHLAAGGLGALAPDLGAGLVRPGLTPAIQDADLLLHDDEGEVYLIGERQGRVVIKVDGDRKSVELLSLVTEGVWHGLHNHGDEVLRMVFGYSPAGFEGYFREIGVPPGQPPKRLTSDDWARINRQFHVTYR